VVAPFGQGTTLAHRIGAPTLYDVWLRLPVILATVVVAAAVVATAAVLASDSHESAGDSQIVSIPVTIATARQWGSTDEIADFGRGGCDWGGIEYAITNQRNGEVLDFGQVWPVGEVIGADGQPADPRSERDVLCVVSTTLEVKRAALYELTLARDSPGGFYPGWESVERYPLDEAVDGINVLVSYCPDGFGAICVDEISWLLADDSSTGPSQP
jgi:hypothetical protein